MIPVDTRILLDTNIVLQIIRENIMSQQLESDYRLISSPNSNLISIVTDIFGGVRTYRAEMSLNPGEGLVFSVTTAEPIQ